MKQTGQGIWRPETEAERLKLWERNYANRAFSEWSEMDATSWGRYFAQFKSKPSLYRTFDELVEECAFFTKSAGIASSTSDQLSVSKPRVG